MGKIINYYVMPHPPVIVPEVGKGAEKGAINTINGCIEIAKEIGENKPEVIIIITPHGPMFRDAIAISYSQSIEGNFSRFGVPELVLKQEIERDLVEKIMQRSKKENIPTVPITENSKPEYNVQFELDHGAMVPLSFINREHRDYKLIHITYGMLPKAELYDFGRVIKKVIEESSITAVVIGSGDLSHALTEDGPYTYNERGKEYDKLIIKLLAEGKVEEIFNIDKSLIKCAAECGLRSFYILLGAMDGLKINGKLLSYEGPFGVGYGVMSFEVEEAEDRRFSDKLKENRNKEITFRRLGESPLVKLARESLEHYVKTGEYINVPEYITSELLNQQRGAFVSLKIEGELRGCIGTISPVTKNLPMEVIRNAVEAGERDPRFFPVEEEELSEIEYSVDVLMPAVSVTREQLNPKKYGVIVRNEQKAGLLLPDLEGVDTVEKQLEIVLNKAGIRANEDYILEKFEVVRYR